MDIKELQERIINNNLKEPNIVFKCSGNGDFIVRQYLDCFAFNNNLDIVVIDSIEELPLPNMFISEYKSVYLIKTDKFDSIIPKTDGYVWVICKKSKCDCISIPTVEEWQIDEYIENKCKHLPKEEVSRLRSTYKDLYKLDLELDKITVFNEESIANLYPLIKQQMFIDYSEYTVFSIIDMILKRNKSVMPNILKELESIDIDPFGFITLLSNNLKHIIDIQLAKNPTAESVGVSSKQFWAIKKYSCGFYNKEELLYLYKLVISMDYKIKSGQIDTKNVIDYLLCKIMAL